jgi:hypothetical protein
VTLLYALARVDPYPTFMAGYEVKAPRTYAEAERAFNEFVKRAFPPRSDAKAAVALITSQGFHVVESTSNGFDLLWTRHAGPCDQYFSILIRENGDGSIFAATGELTPVCP